MKIEKGFTLSQFVDLISDNTDAAELELYELVPEYYKIILYNSFLKQPLKKEMFINEMEEHKHYSLYLKYGSFGNLSGYELTYCQKYQAAEKKVIFKGWINRCENNVIEFESFRRMEHITFYTHHIGYEITDNGADSQSHISTISDLFNIRKGLQLQNVEL